MATEQQSVGIFHVTVVPENFESRTASSTDDADQDDRE
jgi:hypothetical protein